eukprot:3619502-Rhodomonas_salina.2
MSSNDYVGVPGKDMVFRDYGELLLFSHSSPTFAQGAYRMRGIGAGQRIHLFIIPEVQGLMKRKLKACGQNPVISGEPTATAQTLQCVVAWLVINSMRSEQLQWSMLCLQNTRNIYRKNCFWRILKGVEEFVSAVADKDKAATEITVKQSSVTDSAMRSVRRLSQSDGRLQNVTTLSVKECLKVFEEEINFALESSVPDPVPFGKKLLNLLVSHLKFISDEEYDLGKEIVEEVE